MTKLTAPHLGFTLPELLMTIAIVSVIMGGAVPTMQSFISTNRLTTQANSMVGALYLARSESAKRNKIITVRKMSTAWVYGWRVFIDDDGDGIFDAGETEIRTYGDVSINTMNTSFANYISYRPDGRSNTVGSFYFCSSATLANFRRIVISNSGRIRTETQDTSIKTYAAEC